MDRTIKRVEDLPLIMSVKDVVRFLGISTSNAYALFNRSDFPTIRINRRKLVARDNFFKWLELQTNITFEKEVV
ncbi:MAG: helix-turn-helix domain-containing protein [Lachnospirales bacterium]